MNGIDQLFVHYQSTSSTSSMSFFYGYLIMKYIFFYRKIALMLKALNTLHDSIIYILNTSLTQQSQ